MYRYQLSPTRGVLSAMHLNLCSRELRKCPVSHLSMWRVVSIAYRAPVGCQTVRARERR